MTFNQEDIFTSVLQYLYVHNCLQSFPTEERFLTFYEDHFPLVVLRSDSHSSEKKWSEKIINDLTEPALLKCWFCIWVLLFYYYYYYFSFMLFATL